MDKIKSFRSNLRKIILFEHDPQVQAVKFPQICIMYSVFILYFAIFSVQCILEPDYQTLVTYILLTAVFGTSILIVRFIKNHILSLFFCTIFSSIVFAYHFTVTAGTLDSLDAFWLWLVIFPLLCQYFGGVIYGSMAAVPFAILSIIFMWTPVKEAHLDYGSNILEFYPIIEIMSIVVSGVVQYLNSLGTLKKNELEKQNQLEQSEQHMRLQEQLSLYQQNIEAMATLRHDIRHYTNALCNLLEINDVNGAKTLLADISGQRVLSAPVEYCENKLVNSMLSIYVPKVQEHGGHFHVDVVLPDPLSIRQIDLASIIGNLLENAVREIVSLPFGDGDVLLRIRLENQRLMIMEENDYLEAPEFDDDDFPLRNTETDRVGIGTRRIAQVAKMYGGTAGFETDEKRFTARVFLHCKVLERQADS